MGIFVSYSHMDLAPVRKITGVLEQFSGQEVWFDRELRGGDAYFRVIADQILKNDCFVFIASAHSFGSDWCVKELQFAMSNHKRIIAVFIDDAEPPSNVQLVIQGTHYLHWHRLTDEQFAGEVRRCFCADGRFDARQSADSASMEADRRDEEKYFLVAGDLRKIGQLLRLEKDGAYAQCFQPENAVLLGLAYELGKKTEKDLLKAEFYYKVGMYKGNQDARYLYAALMAEKEPDQAAKWVMSMAEAAESGSVFAMTYFGDACYEGRYGLSVDKNRAVSLWRKAADLGSPQAQYYMAFAYRWGECAEEDPGIALMYALSASEHGFPRAFRLIGLLYEYGEFVQKDLEKAREYFEKALKLGDYHSMCMLGNVFYDKEAYEKAVGFYLQAAELADAGKIKSGLPYYRIGICRLFGDGCEKDLHTGIRDYLKAAERKHKNAMKYVVSWIRQLPDLQERLPLLRRAVELNCEDAENDLGNLLDNLARDKETPVTDLVESTLKLIGTLDNIEDDPDTGPEEDQPSPQELRRQALDIWMRGAEKGDIYCAQELVLRYAFAVGKAEYASFQDRSMALKSFQLFFSLIEEERYASLKEYDYICSLWYAYAIELDYDKKPDYALALQYFKKSLELNLKHLKQITGFAVDGFLFPGEFDLPMKKNVHHANDILSLVYKYLPAYLSAEETDKAEAREALNKMIEGYEHIAQCFKKGDGVPRDRVAATVYSAKATLCRSRLAELPQE